MTLQLPLPEDPPVLSSCLAAPSSRAAVLRSFSQRMRTYTKRRGRAGGPVPAVDGSHWPAHAAHRVAERRGQTGPCVPVRRGGALTPDRSSCSPVCSMSTQP